MPKKRTHEEFVEEVRLMWGDEYQVLGKYINSYTKVKFFHKKCENIFDMTPHNFLLGQQCPICCKSPKQIIVGFNSIWDTNPELAKLLLNPDDGYKYTQNSNKRANWKCFKCGYIIKNKKIESVNACGLSCPRCSDGISYPNRLMFSVLSYLHIDFDTEKHFKWCQFIFNDKNYKGRYDFYFKQDNREYIVEMDGKFHFNDNSMSGQTKEESTLVDIEKDKLAIKHNIFPIRVNCEKSELQYIKTEILKSELNNVFDLSKIDWEECQKQSMTSLKLQACELWERYHSTKTISKIMKKNQTTIINWLNSCIGLGMCNYTSGCTCKVFCEEHNEFFNSMTDAGKKYNVCTGNISCCCMGYRKTAGGFHWRYATDEEIEQHRLTE